MTDQKEPKPEFTDRQKLIMSLNRANNSIIKRLESYGVEIDPTGKRNEMFMEKLVEWGIVTSDQMEEFNLAWVDHFNSYLIKTEADFIAAIKERQQAERDARARRKLGIKEDPAALIVPGHSGRQNGNGRRGH